MSSQETNASAPQEIEKGASARLLDKLKRGGAEEAVEKEAGATTPQDGPEERDPKVWEFRGTILGLTCDLGMVIWLQSMSLATMFLHSAHILMGTGLMFPCYPGGVYHLRTIDACFCSYTQAFVRGFGPLALSVFCIFVLRNLLQKRLYYFMLRFKGVIEYGASNPFVDYIFLALLIGYAHLILHVAFILWATGFLTSDNSSNFLQDSGHSVGTIHTVSGAVRDEFAFKLLVELITLVIIPATLFVVFMFCNYDIEASLVPLSQYVHDARDAGEESELAQLEVMEDCYIMEILEDHPTVTKMLAAAESHDDEFKNLQAEYDKQRTELEKKELRKIGLKDSLWPAQLLLPADASHDQPAMAFRAMWMVFFITAMIFEFLVVGLLFLYIHQDFTNVLEGSTVTVFSLGVQCVMLVSVLTIWYRMWHTHRTARTLEVPKTRVTMWNRLWHRQRSTRIVSSMRKEKADDVEEQAEKTD